MKQWRRDITGRTKRGQLSCYQLKQTILSQGRLQSRDKVLGPRAETCMTSSQESRANHSTGAHNATSRSLQTTVPGSTVTEDCPNGHGTAFLSSPAKKLRLDPKNCSPVGRRSQPVSVSLPLRVNPQYEAILGLLSMVHRSQHSERRCLPCSFLIERLNGDPHL